MLLAINTSSMTQVTDVLNVKLGHRPQFIAVTLYLIAEQEDGTELQAKNSLLLLTSAR